MGITYAPDAIEVNVRQYVEWLIHHAASRRVLAIKSSEVIQAARLLCNVAPSSQNPQAIHSLALRLGDIAVRFGQGKSATPGHCRSILKQLVPLICEADCRVAIQALERLGSNSSGSTEQPVDYIEYRSHLGEVMAIRKGLLKKPPNDDLSCRLAVAFDGLKESGCNKPFAILAELLGWSSQKVESRVKKNKLPVREEWPETIWKERFWYSLDPMNWGKVLPKLQPFILKWNG